MEFGGDKGWLRYSPGLRPDEIDTLLSFIERRVRYHMRCPLREYAQQMTDSQHRELLSKRNRIFYRREMEAFKAMSIIPGLQKMFGVFRFPDEENFGHEQVCFRIVRPNRIEDVGQLHRDSWFQKPQGREEPSHDVQRVQMWIPLSGDQARSGLWIVPGSHKNDIPYDWEEKDGKLSFECGAEHQTERYAGVLGEPLLMNYDLLHSGALNTGDTLRISVEATILTQ